MFALRSGKAELERLGQSGVLFRDMSQAMVSTYDQQLTEAQASLGKLIGRRPEMIYMSWGGSGRGVAFREAYDRAVSEERGIVYLALLDPPTFSDLDEPSGDIVSCRTCRHLRGSPCR